MSSQSKEGAHHVLPLRVYLGVWGALLVFTVITVWVGQFDFGPFNMAVAMLVATIKAALVALFFMHLLYDEKFNLVTFVGTVLFVAIFFAFTWADVYTRGWIDPIEKNFVRYDPAQDPYLQGEPPKPPTRANLNPQPAHGADHAAPAGGH